MPKLLIANRGEIAIRIARAAEALGIATVAVHAADDAASLHVRRAGEARALSGDGAAAYLDVAQLVAVARETGCTLVHPGYGFLSESAGFARACAAAGLTFIGPSPETLELFGDKTAARALARGRGVPIVPGTGGVTTLAAAQAFAAEHGAVMIKALAGGGGRGMREVQGPAGIADAFAVCAREAQQAFGNGDLFVEKLVRRARHIEVQIVGDGSGQVVDLGERDCTVQLHHQKLLEMAPSPALTDGRRQELLAAARALAIHVKYAGLGTFEFLVTEGRLLLHRSQPPSPGGAHGDRGGDGGGPGARADPHRARRQARRRGARHDPAGARLRPASPGEPADHRRRRERSSRGRYAHRVHASVGAGRARRHLRVPRLRDEPALRRASRQGHRPRHRLPRHLRRHRPRPRGIRDRRRGDERGAPPRHPPPPAVRRRCQGRHVLRRRERPRARAGSCSGEGGGPRRGGRQRFLRRHGADAGHGRARPRGRGRSRERRHATGAARGDEDGARPSRRARRRGAPRPRRSGGDDRRGCAPAAPRSGRCLERPGELRDRHQHRPPRPPQLRGTTGRRRWRRSTAASPWRSC